MNDLGFWLQIGVIENENLDFDMNLLKSKIGISIAFQKLLLLTTRQSEKNQIQWI
jgi:hypothetical protein